MTKKIGNKGSLSGITSATQAGSVNRTESVDTVQSIRPTTAVGNVSGPSAIGKRRSTRVMSIEEREALLEMVNEEAEKMFGDGKIPNSKKELVTNAVKMALDAGLLPDESDLVKKSK